MPPERVRQVLAETGLEPSCLELELTESLFMSDVTPAVDLLHRMKSLGVKLSIDDFGTGYSSFSYLSRFPIDVLKIDRSFVNDITHDANDAAIVASIITLAHNLRLSVIAEGVETAEQLDYLRQQGCDEMQGYYFSRPLPAQDFEQLLRQRRGLTAAVRGGAITLLPVAAWLTGVLELLTDLGGAVGDWATDLAFSPTMWLGAGLAGLAAVLFVVSGFLADRGVGATPRAPKRDSKQLPPAKPAANATSAIGIDVHWIRTRAFVARCARASANGPAPS